MLALSRNALALFGDPFALNCDALTFRSRAVRMTGSSMARKHRYVDGDKWLDSHARKTKASAVWRLWPKDSQH